MAEKTMARTLVEAFGNVESMQKLYDDDIVWYMSKSLGPIAGPYEGHEAVIAFNKRVWGKFYLPDVQVEILDDVGNEETSAVRFIYSATMARSEKLYKLEYTLFARAKNGKITEVFEGMDTLGSANLFADKPLDLNPYIG